MEKRYISTRGKQEPIDFYQAILQGIGQDGGLIVPDFKLPVLDLNELKDLSYVELAAKVFENFMPSDKEDIKELCKKAYDSGLFIDGVVPVEKAGDVYIAELFQGPTAAFKDMALSMLPHFMTYSLKQKGEERKVMILAATSGDTGKAALEGFKNVDGTCIKVFYPIDGVSPIQKQQMITQEGHNVDVIGIRGNFDDAQTAVKKAFASKELKELCDDHHVFLSSANSINIGRLIPQIVYYFYSYFSLVKQGVVELGKEVNFTIPSGNFGNCLAGYIGKLMGLPIKTFIIASNKNNILTDFFNTGVYNANREFYKTNAPAMDILVSSNLERLLYFVSECTLFVDDCMKQLNEKGVYKVSDELLANIKSQFKAGYLSEEEVLETVEACYKETGYLLDTHTAIGYGVYNRYKEETHDETVNIVLATASPYKFPKSVYSAITKEDLEEYDCIDALYEHTKVEIPYPLKGIKDREVLHNGVIDKDCIIQYISDAIKGE